MSNNQQVTLFQFETNAGPARALVEANMGNELGEGIRSSYPILSIKGGRWHLKYKKTDTVIQAINQQTGRPEPVATLELVILKANPFLNKQYYKGKYVEGSNSPPDCYSLDGKTPSAAVKTPVHSNCALCPMNQWGSMIGDNGAKQKACRDTKKLAVAPLADLRNESLGGPMLFRVPPSALGDLSKLADGMKARGFPYNAVAVRFSFDMTVSHPKPQFNAIRPLTDAEAEIVLELYNSDAVAAILADNDLVADVPATAPTAAFEQEPVVGVGAQAAASPPGPQGPVAQAEPPAAAFTPPPTTFAPAFVPPPPVGMHGAVVQPFNGGGAPPPPPAAAFAPPPPPAANPFASAAPAPAAEAPAAPKTRRKPVAPVDVAPAPVAAAETSNAPPQGQLDDDVNSILAGLSAFTGGAQ
jgi:hypothetical protein